MSDGVAVTPSTASTRQTIDTDEVVRGGQTVQQQVVKISLGADGASDLLLDSGQQTSANSLPVVLPSDQTVPVSIAAAVPVTDNGGSLTIDGTVGISGTVTVSGTVTADAGAGPFPVSDNAGSLTVDDGGGSLTVDGSVNVSGTVTSNQGSAAILAGAWPVKITDGTNTLPTMDAAARAAFHKVTDGTNTAAVKAASTAVAATDPAVVVAVSPNANTRTDLRQINGTAVDQNVGAASNGTQRVAIATDGQGQVTDNAAFADGTTRLDMGGFIFDEVAGTALTENDAAAARVDSKRAQVLVIEDATTRGQRAAVSSAGAVAVNQTQIGGNTVSAGNGISGTGVQRVTIASDSTGVVGLNAGSNVVGKVGIDQTTPGTTNAMQTIPGTTGGLSMSKTISAASTNATSVKGSAGQVYHVLASNAATSARFLKLYNKASAPTVGTDVPVLTLFLPAGGGVGLDIDPMGAAFSTGIAFALTTGVIDNDTGAVGANEIAVNLLYK